MLHKAFIAKWTYPVKDDWTTKVKENLEEFGISYSLEDMKTKSANSFKRMVKNRAKEYILNFLLDKKESRQKMDSLSYSDLKLQNYLKNPDIPVQEAKNLFRFRTRSAKFKENMKNQYQNSTCPFCLVYSDTQQHAVYRCEI